MTHELHDSKPVDFDLAKNDDDLKYVPVWLGEGKEKDLVKGSIEYQAVLEDLGKTDRGSGGFGSTGTK